MVVLRPRPALQWTYVVLPQDAFSSQGEQNTSENQIKQSTSENKIKYREGRS